MISTRVGLCAAVVAAACGTASADVVTQWQGAYQQCIRFEGGAPCPVTRGGPMMALAVFDAINGIDRVLHYSEAYQPYQQGLPAPAPDSSREAAAAAAAKIALLDGYANLPACVSVINSTYNQQLQAIPDGPAKTHGLEWGTLVANSLLASRVNDGYNADPSYMNGTNAGDWRQTPDGPNVPAFSPQWGHCRPWGIMDGGQFRPGRLVAYGTVANLLASQEYEWNINGGPGILSEKDLGRRMGSTRTADQTQIAWFWANDRDGTSKPPGQLADISIFVSKQKGLTLSQNARLFALTNIAMADACIAAWDAKYDTNFDLWRPISAIRETQDDNNPNTIPDPTWTPLNDFTPPFPTFVSGHGSMAAAYAGVMIAFFGDNTTFTIGSDEFRVNPGLGYPANLTRTYNSFSAAAWENALSRIYLGVHFMFDATDANDLGYSVASWDFTHYLQLPADLDGDGQVNSSDLAQLLGNWGAVTSGPADINGDGIVNSADLALLLGKWGQSGI